MAAYNLGCCYKKGEGVPKDYIQAAFGIAKLLRESRMHGHDHDVLNKLAIEGDSDSNAVYVNLDKLLSLDEISSSWFRWRRGLGLKAQE